MKRKSTPIRNMLSFKGKLNELLAKKGMTQAQMARDLVAARRHGALHYYAIAMLAGLRQSEILALPATAIRPEHIAVVGVGKMRGRTKRVVPVCERLKAILAATEGERIQWHPKLHAAVKAAAKVEWQPDILRHSWVSYRLALTGDATRTAMEAGHDPATMARYYVNARTRSEAEAFFKTASERTKPS